MPKDEPIDRLLPGKRVKSAHVSNGHGDVLSLDFDDGTTLVVWAFESPDRLQTVLWKPTTDEVVYDGRSSHCIEFTESYKADDVARFPHDTQVWSPFMTFHWDDRQGYTPRQKACTWINEARKTLNELEERLKSTV